MMEGGTAKIYHCNDSDKCLKVVADATVTITSSKALKSQISALLSSIQNKAVADEKLTDQEKGFISSTTIPVFKYLVDPQMLGVSNSLIYQLTDYIGYDILLQYIQELIQQARAMISTGNYPQSTMDMIMENLNPGECADCRFPVPRSGSAGRLARGGQTNELHAPAGLCPHDDPLPE